MITGTFVCPDAGSTTVKFDNTYSMLRSKQFKFKLYVHHVAEANEVASEMHSADAVESKEMDGVRHQLESMRLAGDSKERNEEGGAGEEGERFD